MLKEVLKKLEGDNCGLSLEEDSDFEGDGTYGYSAYNQANKT